MSYNPLIIYHSPCLDGFTAAWAAWLKYPEAEFVPGIHGQPPPDCRDRRVCLLDFSYKRDVMLSIMRVAKSVVVLDHHVSAQNELMSLGGIHPENSMRTIFDMTKSGARLAWEWFHPGEKVPRLVQLVEDRDLWRFALPNSKELNAAFFSYEYSFSTWNELRDRLQLPIDYVDLVAEGRAIERKHMKEVRELVEKLKHTRAFWAPAPVPPPGWITHQEPLLVPCANLPYTMSSDAAGLMAENAPFAATYYFDGEQYVFSLRSLPNGGADVSKIAASYGGGGHKNAAGFRIERLEDL